MEEFGIDDAAVVWDAAGPDAHGQPALSPEPREVEAGWDRRRRQARGADGDPVWLDATLVVLEEVALGSVVWEGRLDDWDATGTGEPDLYEVIQYKPTRDIDGVETRRELGLARYRGTPPGGG